MEGIEDVEGLSDQGSGEPDPAVTSSEVTEERTVEKTTHSGPEVPVSEGLADRDQEIHDKQQSDLDAEREEHNRRARESAGQDERISDETGERHKS